MTNSEENRRIPADRDVIQQVRDGHPEAFGVLVRRYQARLRAMVAHYVSNHDDVYDLVQDAFLEAFRRQGRAKIKMQNAELWKSCRHGGIPLF